MKPVFCAICLYLMVGAFCVADDAVWYGQPGSGSFGDPSNWNHNVVPGAWDRVFFPFMNYPYTVTFDMGYENKAMVVNGAELTLDLNGNEYYLNCDPQEDPSVVIGQSDTSEISSLLLIHGYVYSQDVVIGLWQDTRGQLTLTGSDAQWTTSFNGNWNGVWLGQIGGDAALNVLDDAAFRHGHGESAIDAASGATIQVDGENSEWYVDGYFGMSVRGNTAVNISSGGLVNIGRLAMAIEPGSTAEIHIESVDQQESEMQLRAGSENSLTVGLNGQAAIRLYNSKLWNQGSMTLAENHGSSGLLEVHEGSWADCRGSLAVGGNFDRAGGTAQIALIDETPGNGVGVQFNITQQAGEYARVWPGGTIALDGGEIIAQYGPSQGNPIILEGGTLEGNGMLWAYLENHGGVVAPTDEYDGNRLSVGYDYTQDATGTLRIALRSNLHYPAIQVNNPAFGQANLDGMLDVDLVGGFVPEYWDEFYIVIAHAVNGAFSNAASQYVFEGGSFDVIYNADTVVLTHYSASPACPYYPMADFNKDCKVNLIDFTMFAGQWLQCNLEPQSECSEQPL